MIKPLASLSWLLLPLCLVGCATSPPAQVENICAIFEEKPGWYQAARKAEKRWGSPISVMMAIMHQESRFRPKARPPRTTLLWIFPGPRKSSAYGFSQAKTGTWDWYRKGSGNWGADRDEFDDAIDFIGWYNRQSRKRSKIEPDDTYHLYLAYHEGHGGFNRRSFRDKDWLKRVAKKVSGRAASYRRQLEGCRERLERRWWWPF